MGKFKDLLTLEPTPEHPQPDITVLKMGVRSNKWIGKCDMCQGILHVETDKFSDAKIISGPCKSCGTDEEVMFHRINSFHGECLVMRLRRKND